MDEFVHLNVHSHYSLLEALPKVKEIINAVKKEGMKAVALTDKDNMYGALPFYKKLKEEGIKPIIGIDLSLFDPAYHSSSAKSHIILLAKNMNGYQNLIRLNTKSHLDHSDGTAFATIEMLRLFCNDLLAIIPAQDSDIARAVAKNDTETSEKLWKMYLEIFGKDNLYIQITRHPEMVGHDERMKALIAFAKKIDAPLVAGHEVYYIKPDDYAARKVEMSIAGKTRGGDDLGGDEASEDYSFISTKTAQRLFEDIPEAISNTKKIADMCNLEIELGKWVFPRYPKDESQSYDDMLREAAYDGIRTRKLVETPELKERVDYELGVIKQKGYSTYFLIVSDLLRHAREVGIMSTTRGSAAGSMVSYLTYITTVNPMEYKLPFERFLNPERPSAPDIDMDIADDKRDEMISYAKKKYGEDKVAQIGTFGTMMARGSVRDTARAMGYSYNEGDRIAKLIPMGSQGFPMTIDRAVEMEPDLKKIYDESPEVREIMNMAKKIEGCARHISVHAAGVVISPTPLTDYTPLQLDPKGGKIITQYDMRAVEDAGLVKFDFLGIRNLAILADAVKRVKKIRNIKVDLDVVPVDDKRTFGMLARGETIGLFQLNGSGMTRYLKELRPSSIHDINAMVALYRPGPMDSIPEYIKRKHNPEFITFLDPRMKDILSQSFGVLTYQDDVMLIAIKLGGYSWLEADKLRKAMGKKIPAEMEIQKVKLKDGLAKNGMSKEKIDELWALIEPFAAYGFNKCITGDTLVIDSKTGKRVSVFDLYKSRSIKNTTSLVENKKVGEAKISAVMENGVKGVSELTTRSGKKIKSTLNHRFFTIEGYKELKDIKVDDYIAVPRKIPTPKNTLKVPAHIANTLGYLISEGNLCHPHGVYFYSANKYEIKDFIDNAKKFKNIKCTVDTSKSATSVYCGAGGKRDANTMVVWLKKLGLLGEKAMSKFIPEDVFNWDDISIARFIGKLWQGDGCIAVSSEQSYYATSSERLARDLSHLLLRLGIISSLKKKDFKYRGNIKVGYVVIVTGSANIIRFGNHILPNLIDKKKSELKQLVIQSKNNLKKNGLAPARGTNDIIPAQILTYIRKEMARLNIGTKKLAKDLNISERLLGFDKKKKGYQRETIRAIGVALNNQEIIDIASSDIFWDKVTDIKSAGREMTYDLSISKHHNFIANDIIVHNSHAASYGRVAYQTAYMKANFPAIYMSAVLTAESGDTEKIAEIIEECKRLKIPVLPPDINESYEPFSVVPRIEGDPMSEDKIRFGLNTIKNFGEGIAHAIVEERKKNGKFASLEDFLRRVQDKNLNKKSVESLIKSGALDAFGERGLLLGNIDKLLSYNKESTPPVGQDSLFGLMSDKSTVPGLKLTQCAPVSFLAKLAWEKELLGLYISGHPVMHFAEKFKDRPDIKTLAEKGIEGVVVVVGGVIDEHKEIFTKKGDKMSFMRISDMSGNMEVVMFPRTFAEFKDIVVPGTCVAIKGKFSRRNGNPSLLAEKVKRIDEMPAETTSNNRTATT